MKSFFDLREAVKSADKKPETYTGPDGKSKIRMVPTDRAVIKNEQAEDDMPASPDEKSMAMKQAKFIEYVADEIEEYLEKNKAFPEWMQNKLSAFHEKAKDMHAVLAGDYDDDEDEDDEKEMKEANSYGPGHIGAIQKMLDKERQTKKYTKPTQAEIDADKKKDQRGKSRPSMTAKSITNKQYGGMKVGLKTEAQISWHHKTQKYHTIKHPDGSHWGVFDHSSYGTKGHEIRKIRDSEGKPIKAADSRKNHWKGYKSGMGTPSDAAKDWAKKHGGTITNHKIKEDISEAKDGDGANIVRDREFKGAKFKFKSHPYGSPEWHANKDAYEKFKAKEKAKAQAKLKAVKEQIDEAAPKLKGDFIKIQRQKDAEHAKGMGVSVKTGRKLPTKTMTSTQRSLAQMRGNK